jgi:hypothetical protein
MRRKTLGVRMKKVDRRRERGDKRVIKRSFLGVCK